MIRRFVLSLFLLSCALTHAQALGDVAITPPSPIWITSTHAVPLRLGQVDPITGNIRLNIPLGPKLPGRIPYGFIWFWDSDASPWTAYVCLGGRCSPTVWPSPAMNTQSMTAYMNGQPYVFLKQVAAGVAVPSVAQIRSWMLARKVDGAGSFPITNVYPSMDGTSFLVATSAGAKGPMAILTEDTAIWTMGPVVITPAILATRTTYITNTWGDRVSVIESMGFLKSGDPYENPYGPTVPAVGMPSKIRIQNENVQGQGGNASAHWIELNFDSMDWTVISGFKVTNGFGLPEVDGTGRRYGLEQIYFTPNNVCNGCMTKTWSCVWDGSFLPMTISSIGTDGVAQSTKLNWTDGNFPTGNTYTGLPSYPLRSIQHPNGLVESFTYGWVSLLSNSISYPDDGTWYRATAKTDPLATELLTP